MPDSEEFGIFLCKYKLCLIPIAEIIQFNVDPACRRQVRLMEHPVYWDCTVYFYTFRKRNLEILNRHYTKVDFGLK